MGQRNLARTFGGVCVALGVVIGAVAVIIALLPSPLNPVIWEKPNALPEFKGPYAPNTILSAAVKVGVGSILAPEAFAFGSDGKGYVTQADGHVVLLSTTGELIEPLFFTGGFIQGNSSSNGLDSVSLRETCTNASKAHKLAFDTPLERSCGRPLGIRYRKEKNKEYLYFLDAYHGLFKYDLASRSAKRLFSPTQDSLTVCGAQADNSSDPVSLSTPKFLNDLDISSDGTIYISESDYKFTRSENRQSLLDGAPRGRVLKYSGDSMCVGMCGLHFPNGVQLSKSQQTLYVAETMRFRVLAVDVAGLSPGSLPSCGEQHVPDGARIAADSTPGPPDNIRGNGRGTIYIGFASKNVKPFSLLHWSLQPGVFPVNLRRLIGKLVPMKMIEKMIPKYGLVGLMRDDPSATDHETIYTTYQDPSGGLAWISHADINPVTGALWLGSHSNPFLGILKMK